VRRWGLLAGATVVVGALAAAYLARTIGRSGTRAAALGGVVAGWLAAWVLWGFAGGLAARWGWLAVYDAPLFAPLALAGGVWQYRAQVRSRERGLLIFVGGQLVWLLFVLARNGALGG
jgi:lipopolysaccharide export LptBFGC system permease protein LptF